MEVLSTTLNVKQGTLQEQDERTVTSPEIRDIIKLTQAEYDALGSKDATTLYVIVG